MSFFNSLHQEKWHTSLAITHSEMWHSSNRNSFKNGRVLYTKENKRGTSTSEVPSSLTVVILLVVDNISCTTNEETEPSKRLTPISPRDSSSFEIPLESSESFSSGR